MGALRRAGVHFLSLMGAGACIALALAVVWWLLVRCFDIPAFILPSPVQVGVEIRGKWLFYGSAALRTFGCALGGYAAAVVLAFGLVFIAASFRKLGKVTTGVLVIAQAIPIIAIAPIVGLYLSRGVLFEMTVSFLIVGLPMWIVVIKGMAFVPPEVITDASSGRKRGVIALVLSRFRFSKGTILGVMRGASPLAVVGVIVGEYVGTGSGLGFQVFYGSITSDAPRLYAAAFLCCACGMLFFSVFDAVFSAVIPEGVEL